MLIDDALEAIRDMVERFIPAHSRAADVRIQQATVEVECLAQCGSFGAESAAIGRMIRVACDFDSLSAISDWRALGQNAAADAAVGAGSSNGAHGHTSDSAEGEPTAECMTEPVDGANFNRKCRGMITLISSGPPLPSRTATCRASRRCPCLRASVRSTTVHP